MAGFPKAAGLAAAVIMVASASFAQVTCKFQTECFETDGCAASAFDVQVDEAQQVMTTEFGDLSVVAKTKDALFAEGPGAVYVLRISDGGARMSVLMDGPTLVSYFGACE